jgi:integrase
MKLTDTEIRKLALPEGTAERTFWDCEVPAFGVRVRATGGRTFVIQYRAGSKQRRLPLGAVGSLSVAKARAMAKEQLAVVRLGSDPFTAKTRARAATAETFGALLPAFLEAKRTGIGTTKKIVPRWLFQVTEFLMVAAKPLHDFAPRRIDRAQISDLIDAVTKERGAVAGNRFRGALSTYFRWLISKGRADWNPVLGTTKTAERPRERTPSMAELRQIWHAVDGEFGTIVKLLILTGARRDMIGSLGWSEIDFDAKLITLPAERMKNGKPFEIPMTPPVIKLLKAQPRREGRDLVFGSGEGAYSGWGQSKQMLDERLPFPAWTLHDFRRSFSTTLNETLKVPPHIVEALLSHLLPGVAGVYNKATYRDEKRVALEQWAEHVDKHVSAAAMVQEAA